MSPASRATSVGLAVTLLIVGLFAVRPYLFDRAEYALLDWRFRLRGVTEPRAPVTIVSLDARSIDEIGRWPWPRATLADLIDGIHAAGAVAVGLDIILSEPEVAVGLAELASVRAALRRRVGSLPPGEEPELRAELRQLDLALERADGDAALGASLGRMRDVVLGYFFRTGAGEDDSPDALNDGLHRVRRSRFSVAKAPVESNAPILTCTGVESNLAAFHDASRRAGFLTAVHDPDGVLRRATLVSRCGDGYYMSLTIGLVELVRGQRAVLLGDADRLTEIRVGEDTFATDEGGQILIDYRGPAGTFPRVAATDVLHGRIEPDAFAGQVVLLGPTEVGLLDFHPTPFGKFPGVEVHANVLENLLARRVIARDDNLVAVELALIVAIGLVLSVALPRFGSTTSATLATGLLVAGFVGSALYAFSARGLWINMSYPLTTIFAVSVIMGVIRSLTVEAGNRRIRRQFSTYVPPDVVDEMIQSPESFQLGGERRDLSILFSDIRDFTTLSERLGPENVANLLHDYLTPMSEIVFESRGTLDKYIGDAVMAFWGAPLEVEDHPVKACDAALAMQASISQLREEARVPGAESLRVGIGIHSAEVVVGNLGSELRFDYTVTGDGVNLCSRLEGLTKSYGVGILASQELVDRLPTGYLTRELDSVRVKGKEGHVHVYEVIGRREATGEETTAFSHYADALVAYREGDWKAADTALCECMAARGGGDRPSELLLERVRSRDHEPPEGWAGVWTFETK